MSRFHRSGLMWRPAVAKNFDGRLALLAGLVSGAFGSAGATEPLKVCAAEQNAPLSYQGLGGQIRGLDMRIAQAAAALMERDLVVVPFDSSYENESTLGQEVNALLSSGICDAVSGFPLLRSDLGPPGRVKARTPDYPGAPRRRDRPFIALREITATQPYQGVAVGAAMRSPGAPWASLSTLRSQHPDWKVGVVSGTLAGTVSMLWRHGALQHQLVSLSQQQSVLELLSEGTVDVAMVPLAQFDGWRLSHPKSPLVLAEWRRSLGVNLGFATLATNEPVRLAINSTIAKALAHGDLRQWAREEGVTWQAPEPPDVSSLPSLAQLAADEP